MQNLKKTHQYAQGTGVDDRHRDQGYMQGHDSDAGNYPPRGDERYMADMPHLGKYHSAGPGNRRHQEQMYHHMADGYPQRQDDYFQRGTKGNMRDNNMRAPPAVSPADQDFRSQVGSDRLGDGDAQRGYEIYVHNVSFDATANDVVNCFRHCGPLLKWYFPRKDSNKLNYGRHRGFGFIYFKTVDGQQRAYEMRSNPPKLGNRYLMIGHNATFPSNSGY